MHRLSNPDIIRLVGIIVGNLPKSSVLIYDTDLRYIFAGGEELTKANYNPEDLIGKHLSEVLPTDRVGYFEPLYRRSFKEHFQIKLETEKYTYLVTFSHLIFGGEKTLYGMAITQNITDLVMAEQGLLQQKELFENVLQAVSAGVWYWPDMNKEVEEWSERYYELLGYTPEELPATIHNFVSLIHPDDREAAFAIQKEHSEITSTFYIEYRIKTKHKGYRWFLVTGKMIPAGNGKAQSMLGSIIDIDDRKRAEAEVREAEMKLASIFNNSFELIGLLLPDGKLVESNIIAQDFFGEDANNLRGKYLWEVGANKKPADVQEIQRKAVADAAKGQTIRLELTYIVNDKPAYQDFSIKPVKDSNGNVIYLIAETRDITEMVMARKNIEEQKFQLENFAYITSHNLRAPAANISMLVNMLEILTDEAERKDILNQVDLSAQKLIDTIGILAEIVKIRKDTSLPKVTIRLDEILKTVKNDLSATIAGSGIEIEADFSQCSTVVFPIPYLESIFTNMLTNSIKYASPERKPHLSIKSYIKENRPVVVFSDNGIGIDLAKHGHKMFGLYKVFTKHTDAHGVGLYLVKNQVESQGGRIEVESEPDKGATFTIYF